jgi:Type II secretion system protein C
VPKKLLAINFVLLAVCALFIGLIVRTSRTPWPAPDPARPRPAARPTPAANPVNGGSTPAAAAYSTIAARNLFSPTRSEAPPAPVAPTATLPKPNLYGVVVREGASIAYLEDPTTKRVAGYRLGDAIAGGTVQAISGDRIVLARPDGNLDVRLHDPSRPRPPAPAPGAPAASAPPGTAEGGAPRTPPGGPPPAAPGTPPTAETPPASRRQLPPNLLRRLPTAPQGNAPQQ